MGKLLTIVVTVAVAGLSRRRKLGAVPTRVVSVISRTRFKPCARGMTMSRVWFWAGSVPQEILEEDWNVWLEMSFLIHPPLQVVSRYIHGTPQQRPALVKAQTWNATPAWSSPFLTSWCKRKYWCAKEYLEKNWKDGQKLGYRCQRIR